MERENAARADAAPADDLPAAWLRLECLKLAMQRAGANDPRPLWEIVRELHEWCLDGKTPSATASEE